MSTGAIFLLRRLVKVEYEDLPALLSCADAIQADSFFKVRCISRHSDRLYPTGCVSLDVWHASPATASMFHVCCRIGSTASTGATWKRHWRAPTISWRARPASAARCSFQHLSQFQDLGAERSFDSALPTFFMEGEPRIVGQMVVKQPSLFPF